MTALKPGTIVKLSRKTHKCTFGPGQYVERFLVGYNSKGQPVIELQPGGYMTVPEKRLAPL